METLLTHELIMKYITGSASDAEQAMVEEAVAESDDCMRQVRSYLYLRENFDSIWDTISAKRIGELWREVVGQKKDSEDFDRKGHAVSDQSGAAVVSSGSSAFSEEEPKVIHLRIYHDEQGQVEAEGADCWRVIKPFKNQQLGIPASIEASENLRIAMDGEHEPERTSAVWCIPLGDGEDAVEITATGSESRDLWQISFHPKCKNEGLLRESMVRILTEVGEERLNFPLEDVGTIPLETGLWRIEISHGREKRFLEIELGELKKTD
jgi:hypothetical protein